MNDDRLNSEAQRQVAEWVRELPKEEPSLVWRAALNEGIRAETAKRERNRWRWAIARPVLGLATTAALAAILFVPRPSTPRTAPPAAGRLEASLVALHEQSIQTDEIVGAGLRPTEVSTAPSFEPDPLDDLDVGVL